MRPWADYLTLELQFSHIYSEGNKEKLIRSLHSFENSIGISPKCLLVLFILLLPLLSATSTTIANHHSSAFPVTAVTITVTTISTTLISISRSHLGSFSDCPFPPPPHHHPFPHLLPQNLFKGGLTWTQQGGSGSGWTAKSNFKIEFRAKTLDITLFTITCE